MPATSTDADDRTEGAQLAFDGLCPFASELEILARTETTDHRGAIFTRREVVDFILDLAGYSSDKPLHRKRVLEPSFGGGDFLLPVVERLLASWVNSGGRGDVVEELSPCVRAVEVHHSTFLGTRAKVVDLLNKSGVEIVAANRLADTWLIRGDFLLEALDGRFDAVVGNPPYVRQELIPGQLLAEYRRRYESVFDRADLYVPFIERSLSLLAGDGKLAFICADRWMKNRYGGPLRRIVSEGFHIEIYVDMVDTPAFQSDVIAYPAITIIARGGAGTTRVARQPTITRVALRKLSRSLLAPRPGAGVVEVQAVAGGDRPWLLDADGKLALVRALEARLPTLEEAGCKVGIGVATGADKAFIAPFDELDVEEDRKLPIVMTRDIVDGVVEWRGFGVINPFADDGRLVNLAEHPRLKRYLEARKVEIAGRHVAQKAPANWYRTIDRITPSLARRSKLLIPDIKGEANIVYEGGRFYPHHNLYYIVSDTWDLEALQAVLRSGIARLFVGAYSTRMRGGYLRFQAQYLRRIRLPRWEDVPESARAMLRSAARNGDVDAGRKALMELYALSEPEFSVLMDARDHGA